MTCFYSRRVALTCFYVSLHVRPPTYLVPDRVPAAIFTGLQTRATAASHVHRWSLSSSATWSPHVQHFSHYRGIPGLYITKTNTAAAVPLHMLCEQLMLMSPEAASFACLPVNTTKTGRWRRKLMDRLAPAQAGKILEAHEHIQGEWLSGVDAEMWPHYTLASVSWCMCKCSHVPRTLL